MTDADIHFQRLVKLDNAEKRRDDILTNILGVVTNDGFNSSVTSPINNNNNSNNGGGLVASKGIKPSVENNISRLKPSSHHVLFDTVDQDDIFLLKPDPDNYPVQNDTNMGANITGVPVISSTITDTHTTSNKHGLDSDHITTSTTTTTINNTSNNDKNHKKIGKNDKNDENNEKMEKNDKNNQIITRFDVNSTTYPLNLDYHTKLSYPTFSIMPTTTYYNHDNYTFKPGVSAREFDSDDEDDYNNKKLNKNNTNQINTSTKSQDSVNILAQRRELQKKQEQEKQQQIQQHARQSNNNNNNNNANNNNDNNNALSSISSFFSDLFTPLTSSSSSSTTTTPSTTSSSHHHNHQTSRRLQQTTPIAGPAASMTSIITNTTRPINNNNNKSLQKNVQNYTLNNNNDIHGDNRRIRYQKVMMPAQRMATIRSDKVMGLLMTVFSLLDIYRLNQIEKELAYRHWIELYYHTRVYYQQNTDKCIDVDIFNNKKDEFMDDVIRFKLPSDLYLYPFIEPSTSSSSSTSNSLHSNNINISTRKNQNNKKQLSLHKQIYNTRQEVLQRYSSSDYIDCDSWLFFIQDFPLYNNDDFAIILQVWIDDYNDDNSTEEEEHEQQQQQQQE